MPGADDPLMQRAARLYRIPGVTAAEVCERFGLSKYKLGKARKSFDSTPYPWRRDLVLSMLTDTGKLPRGQWPAADELARMASYLDFVNKDGSRAADIERFLDELVAEGVLRRDGDAFELLEPFP